MSISNNEIIIGELINDFMLEYSAEFRDNVLMVEISEEKLLNVLSAVVQKHQDIYKNSTGIYADMKNIDLIKVKIGDYEIKATEWFETSNELKSIGFKKDNT